MKTLLKNTAIMVWFAVTLLPLSAVDFDFGATLFNHTAVEKTSPGSDPELDELAALTLWFDLSDGRDGATQWSLAGQLRGEYGTEYDYLDVPVVGDLDYLKFTLLMPSGNGANEFSAGRFQFSDPGEGILSYTADGLSFRMMRPRYSLGLAAGYTGLLINARSDIRMTDADYADIGSSDEEDYFGPRRAFILADFRIPDLGKIREFSLLAAAQFDLRSESDQPVLHTQYLGLVSMRRYGAHFYETFRLVLESGELTVPDEETRFVVGFLLDWDWAYVREDWLDSRITLGLRASPPDFATDLVPGVGVGLLGYVPISHPELGVTVNPRSSGLGIVELGNSFLPLGDGQGPGSRLQPYVKGRGFFRTWPVSVGWIETDPDSDSVFLGTEIEGGIRWRLFSDVGLGLTGALFLPATAPLGAAEESEALWSVGLDISVSF